MMSGFTVDTGDLSQLAQAFRSIAVFGLPPIRHSSTGHSALDASLEELQQALRELSSGAESAVTGHARAIELAGSLYLSTERELATGTGLG
jgi:hypothetical protein